MAVGVYNLIPFVFLQCLHLHRAQQWTVGTLISLRNDSAFTFIDQHQSKPGYLISFLSHAMVEVKVTSGEMRLVAGSTNLPGYRNGFGSSIRFNRPRSIAQINGSTWIIADTDNNCLRTFNYIQNSFSSASSVADWSTSCNQLTASSDVSNTISTSTFYRPWGLEVYGRKIYVTFSRKNSLAVVYPENGHTHILYESTFWNMQQMVVFPDEILLSTSRRELMLSYRDRQLGRVVFQDRKYDFIINENSTTYVEFIDSDIAVVSRSEENVLAFVYQRNETVVRACTGRRGYRDGGHLICMLDRPQCVVKVDEVLYIGEYGSSGGGIRTINMRKDLPEEGWVVPTSVTIAVVVMATTIGIIVYVRLRGKSVSPSTVVRRLRHTIRHTAGRPLPTPRTSVTNQQSNVTMTSSSDYTVPHDSTYISVLSLSVKTTIKSKVKKDFTKPAKKPPILPRKTSYVSYKPPDIVRNSDTLKSDDSEL